MGDVPYGPCRYCKEEGLLRITNFSFPIKCECCSPNHSIRIMHCNTCEAVMPMETQLWVRTEKLLDPVYEGLFKKVV
jgi:hypothetical protein